MRNYSKYQIGNVPGMKHSLVILVYSIGLSWCGCSSVTSKIHELRGESESTVDIPSARFTAVQSEAVEGDAAAQFRLGEWYRTGEEVKRNTAQAYAWFVISAENGYPAAEARVRAGWEPATISRGKELAEILKDKYPNASFIR